MHKRSPKGGLLIKHEEIHLYDTYSLTELFCGVCVCVLSCVQCWVAVSASSMSASSEMLILTDRKVSTDVFSCLRFFRC